MEILENDLSEEGLKALVQKWLDIAPGDLEPMTGSDWIMNKCFVDIGPRGPDGNQHALYNHDGTYSVRSYTPRDDN